MARPRRQPRGRHLGDRGASAVEYAILLAGAVLGIVAVVAGLKVTMGDALSDASDSQSVVSDGTTVSPSNGPTAGTPTPTATPTPSGPTPTTTSATPTPTPTPTTPTPTPTPTPTTPTPTPTPTPSRTALPADGADWTENFPRPNNYDRYSCTVTPPTVGSGRNQTSTGSCSYTTSGTDRIIFNPDRDVPAGTVVTVTWVFVITPGADITITRTFILT